MSLRPATALRAIRCVHTLIWALFVGVILAIPLLAWQRRFSLVLALSSIVLLEGVVLALNRMRCPLTDLAARYSDERSDNFDIYLPLWLARYNKPIFSAIFAAGLLLALIRWLM